MGKQLITIGVGGSLTGLQMKKGAGLDLRKFGPAAIVRSTEIEWDEEQQKWFVHFLQGQRKDTVLTRTDFHEYVVPPIHQTVGEAKLNGWKWQDAMLYSDYEDAVAAEVAAIQAMRKKHGKEFV
jgi:hypothetical protein